MICMTQIMICEILGRACEQDSIYKQSKGVIGRVYHTGTRGIFGGRIELPEQSVGYAPLSNSHRTIQKRLVGYMEAVPNLTG